MCGRAGRECPLTSLLGSISDSFLSVCWRTGWQSALLVGVVSVQSCCCCEQTRTTCLHSPLLSSPSRSSCSPSQLRTARTCRGKPRSWWRRWGDWEEEEGPLCPPAPSLMESRWQPTPPPVTSSTSVRTGAWRWRHARTVCCTTRRCPWLTPYTTTASTAGGWSVGRGRQTGRQSPVQAAPSGSDCSLTARAVRAATSSASTASQHRWQPAGAPTLM